MVRARARQQGHPRAPPPADARAAGPEKKRPGGMAADKQCILFSSRRGTPGTIITMMQCVCAQYCCKALRAHYIRTRGREYRSLVDAICRETGQNAQDEWASIAASASLPDHCLRGQGLAPPIARWPGGK